MRFEFNYMYAPADHAEAPSRAQSQKETPTNNSVRDLLSVNHTCTSMVNGVFERINADSHTAPHQGMAHNQHTLALYMKEPMLPVDHCRRPSQRPATHFAVVSQDTVDIAVSLVVSLYSKILFASRERRPS